ncbi:axoneme-associated protein mst101(2)-like isoform X2 [Phlebotomus argentipes]|uniref:axoneme-associated protein mst101(2)-like isoform X2 n=1 Tax=Phlebotomus argentipes TaxID=94469 RepID=UPI002892A562|nr:axoneme-associated protein mst101(2)-like isoform X2 [Phlebotomus argentipes]
MKEMKLEVKTTADKLMKRFAEGLDRADLSPDKVEKTADPVEGKPSKEFKTEVLTEAMRLAHSRKLNKKLEAELRTLKKEHSALKDMMRDLEQIKESENKLLKTEKGSTKCCADHSEILDSCRENHSSKLCHKGDGQCTCYYCTIFGHTVRKTRSKNRECNHGRNNETRDRLRKRLHQIHNNKEMKPMKSFSKVAPGLFKSVANSAKLNTATSTLKENTGPAIPNPAVLQPPTRRKLLPMPTKDVPLIKPATVGNLISEETEVKVAPKPPPPLHSCNSSAPSSIGRRDSSSCGTVDGTSPLNDILQFIEGAPAPKACDGKDSDKKAAKKERQRQKKNELKKMEELEILKVQYHGDCSKETDAKAEMKALKSVKKKDKKKINEQEAELKRLTRIKSKTESAICEIICEIRENNPDFNFNYQPPKEPKVKTSSKADKVKSQASPCPPPVPPPFISPQFHPISGKSTVSSYVTSGQNPSQMNCEISLDPTKRMVTIRRINLPHAEPQVTVTAKGASPDKDQLLYSFINGQMVPASSLDPMLLKSLQPTTYNMQEQYQASLQQHNKAMQSQPVCRDECCVVPPRLAQLQSQVTSKTKTSIKKQPEPQSSKIMETKAVQAKSQESTQKLTKKQKKAAEAAEKAEKEAKAAKAKKAAEEEKKLKESNKSKTAVKQSVKEEVKLEKKKDVKSDTKDSKIVKESKKTKTQTKKNSEESVPEPSRQVYEIDPEFKANKFGVLDTDEFSDMESTSSDMHLSPAHKVPERSPAKEVQKNPPKSKQKDKMKDDTIKIEKSSGEQKKGAKKGTQETVVQSKVVQEEPSNPPLTKKQKKKLLQQEKNAKIKAESAATTAKASVDRNVSRAEKVAKSLSKSMLKLHLNADTTIELVNDCKSPDKQQGNNISIMEQLNRGIKVEGLTLPPGITLTRVDPSMAEAVKAKKESIGRLCTPIAGQQQQQVEPPRQPPPHMLMTNAMNGGGVPCGMAPDGTGLIMVDPMSNMRRAAPPPAQPSAEELKKSKKKNKKKAKGGKEDPPPGNRARRDSDGQKQSSKIITLRNPMFHAVTDAIRHQSIPMRPQSVPGMTGDPPAAIIKNENGMFTIRNPALHQALSSGVGTNFRQYSPNVYCPTDGQENFSYFSDGLGGCNGNTGKCNSAIGSEMRSAQQKQVPWEPHAGHQQMDSGQQDRDSAFNNIHTHFSQSSGRSYSPFDNQQSYGFNGDFLSSSQTPQAHQHGYFGSGGQMNGGSGGYSVFSGGECSAPHQPVINTQSRFSDADEAELSAKLSELSFLQNLQPGQRLNSEVTIHNISESKFLRNQSSAAANAGSNKVEITRIPNSTAGTCDNLNLAVGSHRSGRMQGMMRTSNGCASSNNGSEILPEFGDSIFAPNQKVNLNELESEERDIETFKRFNYYFEPPKNKPKVNLNLKDIVLNKKKSSPESPSMYFGGTDGNSITSTPSLDEMMQQEYGASHSTDILMDDTSGIHESCNGRDSDSLGVIGSGLKATIHGNIA